MPDPQQQGLRSGSEDADGKFSSTPVDNTTSECDHGIGFVTEAQSDDDPEFEVESESDDDEIVFEASAYAEPDDDSAVWVDEVDDED
ncbi:MAG: hypothetical protein AAF799_07810 [Myxococcota bacterium]